MRRKIGILALLLSFILGSPPAHGDDTKRIRTVVTYVSGTSIYVGAGRDAGLAAGDTVDVFRKGAPLCRLAIVAVSASSASGLVAPLPSREFVQVAVGDSVRFDRRVPRTPTPSAGNPGPVGAVRGAGGARNGPRITGSAALQFAGASASDLGWTYAEPSLLLRLNIDRLLGGGYTLSFNGRSSYDVGPGQIRPDGRGRFGMRIYTFSLRSTDPTAMFGFGVGRIWSPHVSGLGTLDGAEITLNRGGFTVGVIAGFQPEVRTSEFDNTHQKIAAFAAIRVSPSAAGSGRFALGYGQQLLEGKLDRDFLYFQSNWSVGTLFISQSSELDLHQMVEGEKKAKPRLANSYVSMSAQPLSWFGASLGYDATRPLYLLETMRSVPDTLFDSDLYQGFRGGLTFRLPGNILLIGQGSVRSAPGGSRTSRNAGGSVRLLNIGGSGFNAGGQVLWNSGVYTEGREYSISLDRWFDNGLSASVRGGQYRYLQRGFDDQTTATTLNASLTWVTAGGWYCTGSVDQTWDPLRGSTRVLAEIGVHF